jgi:hypothetical protein
MKLSELIEMIDHFAQSPIPSLHGRHVYLWHGSATSLKTIIPPIAQEWLDLHSLTTHLPRTPRANDEASKLLRREIESVLQRIRSSEDRQKIIGITGCDLLSRYKVSANPFFTVASERTMVILVIESIETHFRLSPSVILPEYVNLDTAAPFRYVQAMIGEAATVNISEELA